MTRHTQPAANTQNDHPRDTVTTRCRRMLLPKTQSLDVTVRALLMPGGSGMPTWLTLAGIVAIAEARAIRRGAGTITECTTETFRVHTKAGKIALAATIASAGTWFTWHCIEYANAKTHQPYPA